MLTCDCHGEPQRWNKDSRYQAGGFWRCRVTGREQNRESYRRHRERTNARQRAYHFERGWKVRRLNDLKRQRDRITAELETVG